MARPPHVDWSSEVPELEWVTRATGRVSAALVRDGANLKRLRRHGFDAAALDSDVLARHTRRYSLQLPFGDVEDQGQSGNCWLFAPTVLVRAAALRSGCITAADRFPRATCISSACCSNRTRPSPASAGSPRARTPFVTTRCVGGSRRR